MHRTRNLNNICQTFCNDITNFTNNINKNIHCKSYILNECEKSYTSAECCKSEVPCGIDSDSSLNSSSFSDSSELDSPKKQKICKKVKKEKKITKMRPRKSFEDVEYRFEYKPNSEMSEISSISSSDSSSNSSSSDSKSKKKINTIKSRLCEIKYEKKCDEESSIFCEKISSKSSEDESYDKISSKCKETKENQSYKSIDTLSSKSKNNQSSKSKNIQSTISNNQSSNSSNNQSSNSKNKQSSKTENNQSSKSKNYQSTSSNNCCDNNNCENESSKSCEKKNAHKKTSKYLKLTDVFSRYTSGNNASTSISKHGKYVYLVYNITVDSSGNTVGEIFENKYGHLITKKILHSNNEFPIVNGGYASDNFNKYTLLDNNNIDTARIRIFDSKFNVLATRLFDDYYPNGNSFMGGKFINNGKYIAVTYVYSYDLNNEKQKSVLRILRSDTLEEAFEFKFEGNTYSYVRSFNIKNRCGNLETYLILLTNDGIFDIDKPEASTFSVLKILRMDVCNNNIKLVDQVLLPQLGNYDFIEKDNKILIGVGTYRADISKVKTIFSIKSKSLLLNDGDELRLYKFSDCKLNLIYSKNLDTSVQVFFHPSQNYMLIQQNNVKTNGLLNNTETESNCDDNDIVTYPGFFNINYLCVQNCDISIGNSVITRTAPNNFSAEFSENGKWLIVTGSKENSTESDVYGIKNIQLFKMDLDN